MAEPTENRRDLRIVIIGAGMAGILSAIKLREAGYSNFVIYEKARTLAAPGVQILIPVSLATSRRISIPIRLSRIRTGARFLPVAPKSDPTSKTSPRSTE